jgi:lipopolysaccharide/colanic/teichoic acid biosynthesis glycosyltransferase
LLARLPSRSANYFTTAQKKIQTPIQMPKTLNDANTARGEIGLNMRKDNTATSVADPLVESVSACDRMPLDEETFRRTVAIERKRTERSKAPFLLMLLETTGGVQADNRSVTLDVVLSALMASSRDTDIVGWYKVRTVVGAMFTGLVGSDKDSIAEMIVDRVSAMLKDELTPEQFDQVRISVHFFPDDWNHDKPGRQSNPALYPDLLSQSKSRRPMLLIKRSIDVMGSLALLVICAPAFLCIALAVKLTSEGPVFFRQRRVGQHGRGFTFLKFRTMYVNNDHAVHKEFVMKLIGGREQDGQAKGGDCPYKIKNDARVTRVGRFLRRTSLDELPQFLNVLWGDMSLVGPRPPIPYELAAYQTWHRRRLLDVKPGITGLWQVTGRSTVRFDEMVRLDLRYALSWSPWLDLRILLRTPLAVIKGSGAV